MITTHDHIGNRHDKSAVEFLHLRVEGMECAGCAAKVQGALETRPGVERASVSVAEGRAVVEGHDLDPGELIRTIRASGFDAESLEQEPDSFEKQSEIEIRQRANQRKWGGRALVGLSVWVPLEIIHWTAHGPWMHWLMFAGATLVIIVAGGGFYRSAWKAALRRTTNMDTLISMGATTAYVFSLVVFVAQLLGHNLEQPLYFSESAALLGIISLGHWLEARATAQAGSAVRELLELQPDQAECIDEDGGTWQINSAEVQPGHRLLIRPGGRVPVDGRVIDGVSELDESSVTGEPLPALRQVGDSVIAGTMNTSGRLIIEATVDGRHTTIARVAELVQRAQTSRTNIQRLADRVSAVFVPAVLCIGFVTSVGWWIAGDLGTGLIATVTVLIISCPCALGLATPMAVMVGAGAASKRGILIKSASAIETAGAVSRVIFDKTGTLTQGRPTVVECTVLNSQWSVDEALRYAASVEHPSEHPIAKAIVAAAQAKGLRLFDVEQFQGVIGHGVRGLIHERNVEVRKGTSAAAELVIDGMVAATFRVEDQMRDDAVTAIAQLRELGVGVSMLTGDRGASALKAAGVLGLRESEVVSDATPERKAHHVAELRNEVMLGHQGKLAMVGDGINDAAALAESDVGIAMASGTNIAIEAADIVITNNRVTAVPATLQMARATLRTIRQNLFFAFVYNSAAIPAAALGLLGDHGPIIAAVAMGLSDITVIGNALRLKLRLARGH